jgi:hypothetical protein
MRGVVTTGSGFSETLGIKKLSAGQARKPGFAFAFAVRFAERAQPGFTGVTSVGGSERIIVFRPLDHETSPFFYLESYSIKTQRHSVAYTTYIE